jgi:putative hydrolase of the HAD superfamily
MTTLPCIPKAVIFDVDGTLYDQKKLRLYMVREMFNRVIRQPARMNELRILWYFRRMREKNSAQVTNNLENLQYFWTAHLMGISPEKVRIVVNEWMFERPLNYLKSCRYPSVQTLFSQLNQQEIPIGIFSDYPAEKKLKALGLKAQVVLSATCSEVNRLKPDPTGPLIAAIKLGAQASECLLIGDQEDKDGECARRAGMPYLILASRHKDRQFKEIASWLRDAKKN